LTGSLRYQIVCQNRATPLGPGDLSLAKTIAHGGDAGCWMETLAGFDAESAIVEEPDPLDALRLFLWNQGLQDTTAFLECCLGQLLEYLGRDDPDTAALGRKLASDFAQADRRAGWRSLGRVLTVEDVAETSNAAHCTRVVVGGKPASSRQNPQARSEV